MSFLLVTQQHGDYMNNSIRYGSLSVLLVSLLTFEVVAEAGNLSQAPCSPVLGSSVPQADQYCFSFNAGDAIPVVRTFSFNAPSKGTGILTFNGSMSCSSFNTETSAVVDLASQIVTNVNAAASISGPGGLRHGILILPNPSGNTDSFNLASTRTIKFATAGPKTFFFKLTALRMDALTSCYVYNAAFSMSFAP